MIIESFFKNFTGDILENQGNPASVSLFVRFIATGFFSGYSPVIPGTAGSLVGLALYAIPGMEIPPVLAIATAAVFAIGTWSSARMERVYGEDPSIVVIDEVVGMWISLIFLPKTLWIAALAFFFFRVYDIIKPPPARQSERLRNGWGIMVDDIVAGVYANLTVHVLVLIFPWLS